MERPPRRNKLPVLVFLVAVSWPLCSAASWFAPGTDGFRVGEEGFGSNEDSSGTRKLLQIGGGGVNQAAPAPLPHGQAPSASGPVSAPSPSPWVSAPESSPSPSPSPSSKITAHRSPPRRHPLTTPPQLVRPKPTTRQAEHDHSVETKGHSWFKRSWTTYGLVAAGIAAFLIISVAGAFYFRAKKMGTVRPWATGLSGQLQKAFVTGVPALKRSELETACEDFSNIIGSTSSCTLYKGTLSSGVEIAVASSLVTSADDWSKECESQYRKKITSLSKVSHKNFMNLLGYCEEAQPFTRVMVFEYAPNGTLFEYLHVREAEKLDWMTRLRISMGIAYCLEHMHQLKPPVVPRNFDSTTIYLTDDFAAKVSDLEFWNGAKEPNPTYSNSNSSSDLENTVRKYGIVLLEMLTGRVPDSEDGPLERWASRYFNGEIRLAELIDPSIGSFSEEAACSLCEVVRSCIDPDPKRRPPMSEVAARMREITALGPDRASPKVSPLWWAELEIMSSES
ncbi:probable inactive receptor-like protein kinase At3g56050 isoform X2 [Oryza brachyantha]|uniref:probable inactive receptor-like protein kinase At3g56050 isoform X2 n=1 Tax=Oryza brachyantha TaxID=4533 RepID=UPI000776827B|nr:probable inactive receptor-like protein kinase At3g56050 isoform X2 [Oryza brachyantha]